MDPHRWGQSMVGDPRQPAGMRPARSCTASVDDAHQLVAHRRRFRSASAAARRQARASCLVSLDDYPRPRPLRHGVLHAASPGRAKGQPKYNRCVSRYPQAPPALPGRVDASQGRRVARRRPQPRSHPRLPGGPRNHATQYHSHAQRPARRIHSFFRYVLDTEPALALLCQRVLAIPVKKAPRPVLGYLSDTELAHVLAHPGAPESGTVRCPIHPTSVCPALRQRPTRTAHAPAAANRSAGATLPRHGRTPRR